jgi:hypothetical protein
MKRKDENTGRDAGVDEVQERDAYGPTPEQPLTGEKRGKWSDASQNQGQNQAQNQSQNQGRTSRTSQDSNYVPPARTGVTGIGGQEFPLGGQGEMIDRQALPAEQTDPAYMDTGASSASNTADEDNYMGGGYAGGPNMGSNTMPGSGRDDMSGDMGREEKWTDEEKREGSDGTL